MICTIVSDGEELLINNKNENEKPYTLIKSQIRSIIWDLYCKGYDEFYLNCEYGIPLWAAEFICALKKYNQIKLYIVMPYEEQAVNWHEEYRDRFYNLHCFCDNVYMCNTCYHERCYMDSDKIMVSESDLLLVFGEDKNNLYSVKCAKEKNINIIFYKITY